MSHVERCHEYEQRVMSLLRGEDHLKASVDAYNLYRELGSAGQLPLTCGNRAYFMYHGNANKVAIAGDWTHWQIAMPFNRIRGTDLFYEILEFPEDARLQYKLIVDDEWIVDPGNARSVEEGFGINSEFWMPLYHDPSALWREDPESVHGRVKRHSLESSEFGLREFFLYTPVTADVSGAELPLLMVHDGEEALRLGRFSVILDNLIAQNRIPPCAVLFVPPHDRGAEYMLNSRYLEFCVEELLPTALDVWNRTSIQVTTMSRLHAVLGASLGGLLALWTITEFPGTFATCIAQSPALWPQRGRIFRLVEQADLSRSRVIIQTGTIGDASELACLMAARLSSWGIDATYLAYNQGHTWGNWRSTFADAVEAWIGTAVDHSPSCIKGSE